jgi:hypothetical protein
LKSQSRSAPPWTAPRTAIRYKISCAFAEGNHYAQQHIVADIPAGDSLTKHIKRFFPNFLRVDGGFKPFD